MTTLVSAPAIGSLGRPNVGVHVWVQFTEAMRTLSRQPAYLLFNIVQPALWLLLFGSLFKAIGALPAFGGIDYLTYLAPGVVIMTAMSSAGWAGTGFIHDMERGVMDRNLTSPISRGALIAGGLAQQAVITIGQSLIVFGIALAAGARFPGGVAGAAVMVLAAVLLALVFASLSYCLALLTRQHEALIGASQFLVLPLMFLSSILMAPALMPGWVATVARYNPVDWAAVAAREAVLSGPSWGQAGIRLILLAALAVVMAVLAGRAFRAYQRSV